MSTAPRSSGESKPAPVVTLAAAGRSVLGLAIVVGCYLAGEFAKSRLGLIVPGSVLGLFLLLGLLGAGIVRLAWVEDAGRLLLFALPLSFVPIYVGAAEDRALWKEWGLIIGGTLAFTVALLWLFAGWLAQWLLRARERKVSE